MSEHRAYASTRRRVHATPSVRDIMERCSITHPAILRDGMQLVYDTADALVCDVDGGFTIMRSCNERLPSDPPTDGDGIVLRPEQYASRSGLRFRADERAAFTDVYTPKEIHLSEDEAQQGTSPPARALRYLLRADDDPQRVELLITESFHSWGAYSATKCAVLRIPETPQVQTLHAWRVTIATYTFSLDTLQAPTHYRTGPRP